MLPVFLRKYIFLALNYGSTVYNALQIFFKVHVRYEIHARHVKQDIYILFFVLCCGLMDEIQCLSKQSGIQLSAS